MHDKFEPHFATHRGLAKNAPDIEQPNAPNFEQVLKQFRAPPFNGGLVDTVEVDGVIGHQPVATGNQLQPQLALSQSRLTGNEHPKTQNVHEHAVHRRSVGKMLGQVSAQHVDHKR